MIDRDKVISRLQIIRTWAEVGKNYDGIQGEGCLRDIVDWIDDALELLKEQEPRALTFEEMDSLANKREETVVYLERRWDTSIYGAIAGHCNGVLPNLSCIGTMRNVIQQYNQTWRCWSSKPTQEQREAVPWTE